MSKLIFSDEKTIFISEDGSVKEFESTHIRQHIDNIRQSKEKNEWKTKGAGAMFMFGAESMLSADEDIEYFINGVCPYNDTEVLYSATANKTSGIFAKTITDEENVPERHIVHSGKERFGTIDFDKEGNTIATSVGFTGFPKTDIAVFLVGDGTLKRLTDGDSSDNNPSFSRFNGKILFDTKGIGRNYNQEIVGFSNTYISAVSLDGSRIEDVLEDKRFDLIKPKQDSEGNLYYIKRPYGKQPKNIGGVLLDIVLFPFRVIKSIFGWLNIFSMRYGGTALNTAGANPAKEKQKSQKQLIIEGNVINAQQNLKQNQKKSGKYAGIAPHNWHLVKRDLNGNEVVLYKGLFDYCLSGSSVVICNGKYIVQLNSDKEPIKRDAVYRINCF